MKSMRLNYKSSSQIWDLLRNHRKKQNTTWNTLKKARKLYRRRFKNYRRNLVTASRRLEKLFKSYRYLLRFHWNPLWDKSDAYITYLITHSIMVVLCKRVVHCIAVIISFCLVRASKHWCILELHDLRFFCESISRHQIVTTSWLFTTIKVKIWLKFKVIFSFWNIVMIEQVRMKNTYFYVNLPKPVHQHSWE